LIRASFALGIYKLSSRTSIEGDTMRCLPSPLDEADRKETQMIPEAISKPISKPIPKTMQALVKTHAGPGMEMREMPVPTIGETDVLVAVETASVCGTDLHIFHWDEWAQARIKPPYIPGHEFCGTVAAVGARVQGIAVGDFVSAEMHVACGHCVQCRSGQAHVCQFVKILGVDADGAFADYVKIPATNIWKLDPSIPRDFGSLFDPFGNAVHTVLSGAIAGLTVAVTGCGPIGLFAIAVAKACGASTVFAIEPNAQRLALAKTMGADVLLDSATDVVAQVKEATGGNGVDVLLEMSGHPAAIRQGFQMLRMGGRASLLGIPSRPVELDLADALIFKGATVHGINGRKMYETWFQAEALLRSGKINLAPVITNRLPLAKFDEAMKLLESGEASKILLKIKE
jgi:threonine 3-dehydrogenase